jgi:hypothetical protein
VVYWIATSVEVVKWVSVGQTNQMHPAERDSTYLRNVSTHLLDYTVQELIRRHLINFHRRENPRSHKCFKTADDSAS